MLRARLTLRRGPAILLWLVIANGWPAHAAPEARPTIKRLLTRHLGYAWLKRLALEDRVGGQSWHVDLEREVLRFGTGPEHRVQLLGTESKASSDFLWAWANTASHLPPGALRSSEELRTFGTRNRIPELTTRKLALDVLDGEQVGVLGSGLLNAGAFYLGDHGDGVAVLLLVDFPKPEQIDRSAKRIIRVVGEIISAHAVDHRLLLEGLAQDIGAHLQPEGKARVLVTSQGESIRFSFDSHGRIEGMEAKLTR